MRQDNEFFSLHREPSHTNKLSGVIQYKKKTRPHETIRIVVGKELFGTPPGSFSFFKWLRHETTRAIKPANRFHARANTPASRDPPVYRLLGRALLYNDFCYFHHGATNSITRRGILGS